MKKKGRRNRKTCVQPPRGNWGNAYARARMKAGFRQDEASRELHIDTKIISNIENDKHNPTPDIALAMAKLYGDDRLPRKICREVCAIGRARTIPFDFNLEVVVPLMSKKFDEIRGVLHQLPVLLQKMESHGDFDREEWELLLDYANRIWKFSRDVEILETSVDRMIEKAEKKTAFAAR